VPAGCREKEKDFSVALSPSIHWHTHKHLPMDAYVHTAYMQYMGVSLQFIGGRGGSLKYVCPA